MIDYQTYCQVRQLYTEKKLSVRQIARELELDLKTVRKWVKRESYEKAPLPKRASKLDPHKAEIIRLLERHAYSAQQIFQQIKERGFEGGYTILKEFVRQVRPKPKPAFPHPAFSTRRVRPGGLGLRGVCAGGLHPAPSFFLCHGAGFQPQNVSGVHPG